MMQSAALFPVRVKYGSTMLYQRSVAGRRARLGLGRTFQAATLYPRLSIRECVQVALESQRRSEIVPSLFASPVHSNRDLESSSRGRPARSSRTRGEGGATHRYALDWHAQDRRVACLLALRPKVVLLDEPMAGIAQRESEAFGSLLLSIRRELGAAMLVIEHDVPLITEISDRLYCLETGQGHCVRPPHEVREDPRVIASYLGTDRRAIARVVRMPFHPINRLLSPQEAPTNEAKQDISLVGIFAARLRMSEGQFYTTVIAVILSLLLTMTGLPGTAKPRGLGSCRLRR